MTSRPAVGGTAKVPRREVRMTSRPAVGGTAKVPRREVRMTSRRVEGDCHRYWPVFATVSMDRPASLPLLPETSVLM